MEDTREAVSSERVRSSSELRFVDDVPPNVLEVVTKTTLEGWGFSIRTCCDSSAAATVFVADREASIGRPFGAVGHSRSSLEETNKVDVFCSLRVLVLFPMTRQTCFWTAIENNGIDCVHSNVIGASGNRPVEQGILTARQVVTAFYANSTPRSLFDHWTSRPKCGELTLMITSHTQFYEDQGTSKGSRPISNRIFTRCFAFVKIQHGLL
jgi:hypothetical protein